MEEPSAITHTRTETYDFELDGRRFTVSYTHNSLEETGVLKPLDENVQLEESFVNKYKSPTLGAYAVRTEIIREVIRNLTEAGNCVQVDQWRDIPKGLEALLDNLPAHVRSLLRTEYSDEGVIPCDFEFQD